MPSKLFQIRRGFGATVSGILPAYATPIGTPLGFASINQLTGERTWGLSNGAAAVAAAGGAALNTHVAFQARDSRIFPGLSDTELLWNFGLETPYWVGTAGSAEPGEDVEVEGTQYVLTSAVTAFPDGSTVGVSSVSGQVINNGTAPETELTFANGLFAVAVSGDQVLYRLQAVMLNIQVAGNVRIFATNVPGYVKK